MTTSTQKLLEEIEKSNSEARAHLARFKVVQQELKDLEQSRLNSWMKFIKENLKAITGES